MGTSGNTVLITGGATGIGFALAEALVKGGNDVIICGRRLDRLRAAKKRLPAVHTRMCDVSRRTSREALVTWVTNRFPSLNMLVNNAGIQRVIDFRKGGRDLPDVDAELSTNLAAPIHLSALLIPHLRKRQRAAILNISSGLAFTPVAVVPVYGATKAAIHSFSLSLRHQLRDTTVRVFEVAPPIVDTELSRRRDRPPGTMSAQEVAAGILDAIEHDTYEVALGTAANLYRQRDALFAVIND
ncbi:MAG: SDR family oxidoreductase [Vicinamibacterales bacterium]